MVSITASVSVHESPSRWNRVCDGRVGKTVLELGRNSVIEGLGDSVINSKLSVFKVLLPQKRPRTCTQPETPWCAEKGERGGIHCNRTEDAYFASDDRYLRIHI